MVKEQLDNSIRTPWRAGVIRIRSNPSPGRPGAAERGKMAMVFAYATFGRREDGAPDGNYKHFWRPRGGRQTLID